MVVFPKYQKTAKQKLISSHSLISKTEEGFINRSSVKKVVMYRKTKILIKLQIGISNEFFIPKLKFSEAKSCIAGVAWYRPDKTGQDQTRPDKTGQDRTGLDRTRQDQTRLDKTGQDRKTGPRVPWVHKLID